MPAPSIEFRNPPLLESIVELRWDVGSTPFILPGTENSIEEFFMNFGGEVYQKGYKRAERLVPSGFPFPPYQNVYRYKRTEDQNKAANNTTLYQVGQGIFTANALPPYKTWEQFHPEIEKGIDALFTAINRSDLKVTVSLRYINAFRGEILSNLSPQKFMNDVLGLSIVLPTPLSNIMPQHQNFKPLLQLEDLLSNGMTLGVAVGDAIVNGDKACLLDLVIHQKEPVVSRTDVVMGWLDEQHTLLRTLFVDMTEKIHANMGIVAT